MDLYGHNPFSSRKPDLSNPPYPNGFMDFSDIGRLNQLVQRHLAKPRKSKPIKLFLSEWTIPTERDSEFNFWVTPKVQAEWIRAGLRIARKQPYVHTVGWIHVIDNPQIVDGFPATAGGLFFSDGRQKPGFDAFRRN